MSWESFKSSILKIKESRHHKISNSLGVYDLYKYIRKNKWFDIPRPLTEKEFYSIVRNTNNLLADELVKGNDVILPNRLGRLELRKYKSNITFDGKKIKTNLPIDWIRTIKLWYEDKKSYRDKTLIRIEEKEMFKVCYNKSMANYNNKSFIEFSVNRIIKKRLKDNIKNKLIDAYEMGRVTI